MNEESDLCCDDLLQEIALGAVEGILEDSDDDLFDAPITPEGDSIFIDSCGGGSLSTSFTTVQESGALWSTDSFMMSPGMPVRVPSALSQQNTVTDASGEITTVMLRNIPNKYTRAGLLVALEDQGFDPSSCNNLYLPMDPESGCNLGYAFLNFLSHGHALEFKKLLDGCRLPSSGSRKICSVVWANKQGLFQFANNNNSCLQTTTQHIPTRLSPFSAMGLFEHQQLSLPSPPPHNYPFMMQQEEMPMYPPPPGTYSTFVESNPFLQHNPMMPPIQPATPPIRYHQLPPMEPTKIFIGGLPVSTTDADLFAYFSKFGPIKECNIIINKETGLSRGFGFVDFLYQESVRIVDEAQQRRPHVINCRVVSVRFYGAYTQ